jgi:D-serine deaminase-like pyridoxal phosphate-dependent protein
MLSQFPDLDEEYRLKGLDRVLTPALAIYPSIVDSNIEVTLRLLDNDPNRWRPHVKTAKLACIMKRYVEKGVTQFKCSTTLELLTVLKAGASDALLAYPLVGAGVRRVQEIANRFPAARVSALVENPDQVFAWRGARVDLFVDVNPGMDRTGIEQERSEEILATVRSILEAGLVFRGLHYYDGHLSKYEFAEREPVAHRGYDRLIDIVAMLQRAGLAIDEVIDEVITAGTPAFPCSLSYGGFQKAGFTHRISPGTIVYCDATSLSQLPAEYGYRPAALVISTVVSHPTANRITCDAGHKTVSADAGAPTCAVMGRPDLSPAKPSEEHLPIDCEHRSTMPRIGESLYLVPRHICPTVNNFDHALLVDRGEIVSVERVTARGRESPVLLDTRIGIRFTSSPASC